MESNENISILDYLGVLIKYRWLIFYIVVFSFVLSVIYSLLKTPIYTSRTTVLPNKESEQSTLRSLGNIPGLAGTFGIPFIGGSSSELYPDILMSRQILIPVLNKNFTLRKSNETRKLIDILSKPGKNEDYRLELALRKLRNMIRVSKNRVTGIITIEVESNDKYLSADIANALTEQLDYYNREVRTSKAKENRIFVEERMKEAKDSLTIAENRYKEFREKNVAFDLSPELMVEEERLKRDVEIKQEAYKSLTVEYWAALVEEQKDIPVVNVLEKAVPPLLRTKPKRKFIVIISVLIGTLAGIIIAYFVEFFKKVRLEFKTDPKYQVYFNFV
ncbi:hypothetical protein DRQ09_05340 [candidate division KSB1 bacterium]|nr:MAG: hypothetical protein DRQ09_05340 [candidate division KSB1 bacterium]